jgi:selenium-binding protein 1
LRRPFLSNRIWILDVATDAAKPRIDVSNSLLSTLDHSGHFYVRLTHIGPDGMKVDPFFNIDLNKFPTSPARGHDMLIN